MKKLILAILFIASFQTIRAQVQRAYLSEDFSIQIERSLEKTPWVFSRQASFSQMDGFPEAALADRTFKNLRNITLVDLDEDGDHEILWNARNKLFAYEAEGLLWERSFNTVAIYPPSVADLDGDGELEIAQATGGSPTSNAIYLINEQGEDFPGWPLSFNGHWILLAPTLADVDGNDTLEILFNERDLPQSKLHIVNKDGTSFSDDWPLAIDGSLAITPSVGDVDADGEKEIYTASTTGRYLIQLNGTIETGIWPQITGPDQRYSFQSPILVDLDGNNTLEIVGASHGNVPQYFILEAEGTFHPGWPKIIPDSSWTFNPPTVVALDGQARIFMSRPITEFADDMLFSWRPDGTSFDGFPINLEGGLEGIISVADVDGDDEMELLFGSNLLLPDGKSFIHAYELDGQTPVEGFPIRPDGWTFMNGANLGDVNGDGMMDLVAVTYTQDFGLSTIDSVFLNVYELNVPYAPERILWSTYKGSNTRDGLVELPAITSTEAFNALPSIDWQLYPNPAKDQIQMQLDLPQAEQVQLQVFNAQGQMVKPLYQAKLPAGIHSFKWSLTSLPQGLYHIQLQYGAERVESRRFVKH